MDYVKVHNWDKWQSYRADRGQPPWIKVHREVMRKPEWVALSDAEKGQLTALWLLAADRNGEIPVDPAVLKKLCYLDSEPNLELFIKQGFIDHGAALTPSRRQHDQPEAEAEAEAEAEDIPPKTVELSKPKVSTTCPYGDIVSLYHAACPQLPQVRELTPRRRKAIKARWSEHPKRRALDWWEKYFRVAAATPFLTGSNARNWRADFDFLVNPSKMTKILEGGYDA